MAPFLRLLATLVALLAGTARAADAPTDPFPYVTASGNGLYTHGSGVVVGADGRMLTALHVVWGASRIVVDLGAGGKVAARVVGIVPDADLAELRLPPRAGGYAFRRVAPAAWRGRAGEAVSVPGHPLSFHRTTLRGTLVQDGYESSQRFMSLKGSGSPDSQRMLGVSDVDILLLDVLASNGLSGAPILSSGGEVVAILSGSYSQTGGFAFASPVSNLQRRSYVRYDVDPVRILRWAPFTFAKLGYLRSSEGGGAGSLCDEAMDRHEQAVAVYRSALVFMLGRTSAAANMIDRLGAGGSPELTRMMVQSGLEAPLASAERATTSMDQSRADARVACDPSRRLAAIRAAAEKAPVTSRNILMARSFTEEGQRIFQRMKIEDEAVKAEEDRSSDKFLQVVKPLAEIAGKEGDYGRKLRATLAVLQPMASDTAATDADLQAQRTLRYVNDMVERWSGYRWNEMPDTPGPSNGLRLALAPGWVRADRAFLAQYDPGGSISGSFAALPATTSLLFHFPNVMRPDADIVATAWPAAPLSGPIPGDTFDWQAAMDQVIRQMAQGVPVSATRSRIWRDGPDVVAQGVVVDDARTVYFMRLTRRGRVFMTCSGRPAPADRCLDQFARITLP